jgi:hypothetical protein
MQRIKAEAVEQEIFGKRRLKKGTTKHDDLSEHYANGSVVDDF